MRATTAFNTLLDLDGITVDEVRVEPERVTVAVRLRRRRLLCPVEGCGYSTRSRADTRPHDSSWRSLDMGPRECVVTARLRRLDCPEHGVLVEQVPFARHRVRFTRDFEDLVAWCTSKMDKTAVTRLLRIAWVTVGAIVERVVADGIDPARFDDLAAIGVDEISWKKHHHYLTVVVDHGSGDVIWSGEGKNAKALDAFFAELGPQRSAQLEAISMDMGLAYPKSAAAHAPQATICYDPFHVVKVATDALNAVRREHWNAADALAAIRRSGGAVWRGYKGKEALRAIFAGDLAPAEQELLVDRWCAWAQRSRLTAFVKAGRTIRAHRDAILAALRLGYSNERASHCASW